MELHICGLTKTYGEVKALDEIETVLTEGVYALLGPNGAGKSTLLGILSTLLVQDSGEVLLDGVPVAQQKKAYLQMLGYMPQKQCLYEDFTMKEFLYYIGRLKGMKKEDIIRCAQTLSREVLLEEVYEKKIKTFSGGMKQRVMLAAALMKQPRILILDEPTAGLDPMKRIEMQNMIASFSKDKIVIIATHVVSDVEFIADKFLFLKKGRLILQDTRKEVCAKVEGMVKEVLMDMEAYQRQKRQLVVSSLHFEGEQLAVRLIDEEHRFNGREVPPSIGDVYLHLFKDEHHAVL